MKIPPRLLDFLNRQRVRYDILHHPIAFTAQELAAIEGVKGREHAKVVVVKVAGQLALAVLPADRRVDLGALGATAVATEAEFREAFPDCETGTMPPFGHLYGVATFVDQRLAENARVTFEAGTHTDAMQMSYADYARLAQATVKDFAVKH